MLDVSHTLGQREESDAGGYPALSVRQYLAFRGQAVPAERHPSFLHGTPDNVSAGISSERGDVCSLLADAEVSRRLFHGLQRSSERRYKSFRVEQQSASTASVFSKAFRNYLKYHGTIESYLMTTSELRRPLNKDNFQAVAKVTY